MDVLDLHEVYVKTDVGLTKMAEVRGTRKDQVNLRRAVRQKTDCPTSNVVLYTNGKMRKVGIDKGK